MNRFFPVGSVGSQRQAVVTKLTQRKERQKGWGPSERDKMNRKENENQYIQYMELYISKFKITIISKKQIDN